MTREMRVLVCAPMMPEFDRESGSRRLYDLILFLKEAGWSVTFVAQRAPEGERYKRLMQRLGIMTHVGFDSEVDQMMTVGGFDVALFVFWNVAEDHLPFLRRVSPSTRVLVDSVDLHFMRNARWIFLGAQQDPSNGLLNEQYAGELVRELNAYAASDGVLTVSQKEADLVNDLLSDPHQAHCVPDGEDMEISPVPLRERRGVLFLGNFRHPPNIDAVEYLCKEILPGVDPALLEEHPVYVVGNGMDDAIRKLGDNLPCVRMIGWVPSVLPYLEQTRITVVPLLYGAGTKRKVIQALMVGTPTVMTSIGAEGLNLEDGRHALIADNADAFAEGIARLLRDDTLWTRLSEQGHAQVAATHSRETARQRLLEVVSAVKEREPKPAALAGANQDQKYRLSQQYSQVVEQIREVVHRSVPPDATVIVVSRGDEELLKLRGRAAMHFPQNEAGAYAGYHPKDSSEAIAHLEALRAKGGTHLLFPSTAFWWLDHYHEFKQYLECRHPEGVVREKDCLIFSLK